MKYPPEVNAYQANADRTRGSIIYHTIFLERVIDAIIARHFFPSADDPKHNELKKLLIADRMDFSRKVEVFTELLKAHCVNTKTIFTQVYPRFGDDFKEIGQTRNDFAHNLSLIPDRQYLKDSEIILYKYKKSDAVKYTIDDINAIMAKIKKYVEMFTNFE